MKVINLLDFLNSVSNLYTLKFAKCGDELVNFLDLMTEDEQFTQKIDLGIIYIYQKTLNNYILIDGLSRFLSLSLLLHAVCECYKKTSAQNDKAIKTIRSKYLFHESKTKLRLPKTEQDIYEKIINGERLSGKEKEHPIFILLHNFWSSIKEENLQASKIFKMLQKIVITVVEAEDVSLLDLYCTLNKNTKGIDSLMLIAQYLKLLKLDNDWNIVRNLFQDKKADIVLFLKDFFITKFNYKKFDENRMYDFFVNYFETMLQYNKPEIVTQKIVNSAKIYKKILNVEFENENIRNAFIKIKMHDGEDTYAYLLNIFDDYYSGNISEATLLEILSTIEEYLKNRQKNNNDVVFNELIEYLNAFITCK